MKTYNESNTILAVAWGRFIPVEKYEISVQTNTNQIKSLSSIDQKVKTTNKVYGELLGMRNPMPSGMADMWIISSEMRQKVVNCMITNISHNSSKNAYSLEFMGDNIIKEDR